MSNSKSIEEIRAHWEKAGQKQGEDVKTTPTSRDPYLADLETKFIIQHLRPNYKVLEIGCGDGGHTRKYSKYVNKILGIDISKSLIKKAQKRLSHTENTELACSSVLDLKSRFENGWLDCVISQRCLINLPTWDYQKKALQIVHGLLKKGGIFILTEGFEEGLERLNLLRSRNGLDAIKVVSYNKFFKRDKFEEFVQKFFSTEDFRDYGFYLLLSRLIYPLVIFPEKPKHDSRFNAIAKNISTQLGEIKLEEYSYNLFYCLKKK
jgi:SAM-dependent methyltransferase